MWVLFSILATPPQSVFFVIFFLSKASVCALMCSLENNIMIVYMVRILDQPPNLLLDARHVRIRWVDQSGDLCGSNETLLRYRPAQVQPRRCQVRLHGPVGVWGALILTRLAIHQLWNTWGLARHLEGGSDVLNFWLSQETHHFSRIEEFIVALETKIKTA